MNSFTDLTGPPPTTLGGAPPRSQQIMDDFLDPETKSLINTIQSSSLQFSLVSLLSELQSLASGPSGDGDWNTAHRILDMEKERKRGSVPDGFGAEQSGRKMAQGSISPTLVKFLNLWDEAGNVDTLDVICWAFFPKLYENDKLVYETKIKIDILDLSVKATALQETKNQALIPVLEVFKERELRRLTEDLMEKNELVWQNYAQHSRFLQA